MSEYETVKFSLFLKKFGNRAGGFETALWNAFAAADIFNMVKLSMGFPVHHQVYRDWYNSPSEREYFAEYLQEQEASND
jgi:hypothetical protein